MSDSIPTSATEKAKTLTFVVSYDRAINYAFQQNAIPVVKELRLRNDATPRKALTLRVTTEPAFATPIDLHLQSLDAEAEFRVAPLDIKLSHDFLATLSEKVAGWLRMEILENERVLYSQTEPVSLLARNEWCGLVSLPEILAAFVLPNDPAVMTILGRATEILTAKRLLSLMKLYSRWREKRASSANFWMTHPTTLLLLPRQSPVFSARLQEFARLTHRLLRPRLLRNRFLVRFGPKVSRLLMHSSERVRGVNLSTPTW